MARKTTKIPQKKAAAAKSKAKTTTKVVEPPVELVKKKRRAMVDNPQIGFLTPEEFEAIGRSALGGRGWQRALMRGTGIAQTTITRYLRGVFPIPKTMALIMNMLQTLRNNGLPIPSEFFEDVGTKRD